MIFPQRGILESMILNHFRCGVFSARCTQTIPKSQTKVEFFVSPKKRAFLGYKVSFSKATFAELFRCCCCWAIFLVEGGLDVEERVSRRSHSYFFGSQVK